MPEQGVAMTANVKSIGDVADFEKQKYQLTTKAKYICNQLKVCSPAAILPMRC